MAPNDDTGGRPPKEGIDWFPLQTTLDTKFAFVISRVRHDYRNEEQPFIYAEAARNIILRMYQQIYNEKGWYYPWDEDHMLLWIEEKRLGYDFTTYTIDLALDHGIFHEKIYQQYRVLTSKGLQERYLNATYKRKHVILFKELVLTDNLDRQNIIIKSVSDNNNQDEINFSLEEIEESKKQPKQTKPERSKIKEITQKLIGLWNDKNDTRLRFLDSRLRQVERRLRTYTPKDFQAAIIYRASDPWIAENNQQSNWDAVFRTDKAVDEWLNRPPKNGRKKDFNPADDNEWLTKDNAQLHAEHHRKELSPKFYKMTKFKGKKYFHPVFTNDMNIPQPQNS
jgi:hypothetical protein